MKSPITPEARALRELRQHGKEAVVALEALIADIDAAFKQRESVERGRLIGQLTGSMEYAKDCLKHFGLKMELGKPAKKQPANPK